MGNFEFVRNLGGGNNFPARHRLEVAASQDISAGDALVLSSGQLELAGDGTGTIAAIAAQDASELAQGTEIDVYIVQPFHVWRGTASADASSNVLDGERAYDLNASQQVNLADTTGGCVQIIAVDDDDNTVVDVMFTSCFFA